ncbi:MAG: 2-amino-4-hydroxy-6-hydroxymethyldihydropteridine diphosphokinase [Eubacteriales bacterium]|nr:2-amino-4-hydroxy-6-hydroxymethyldihydropteridine diphosphokinase [Eubacteriales bacterium]
MTPVAYKDSDRIEMRGLKFFSHIGYFDFEQENGQNFLIDLSYEIGQPPATLNDCLEDSVSYADVYTFIAEFMAKARHRLIEYAASELISELFQAFPAIQAIELSLAKPEAPIKGEFEAMAFTLYRRRWTEIAIGLGGNLGPVRENLGLAVQQLYQDPLFRKQRVSSIYRSKAWGVRDQADFLNAVLLAETKLSPWALLDYLKSIEKELGRQKSRRWGERAIDLDVLSYGELRLESPKLSIPHLSMEQRPFVLLPLAEVKTGLIPTERQLEWVGLELLDRFNNFECQVRVE